ncbi:(4Fe-4S)-binding protein [Kitasatospora sp. NPDC096147]|uniref:(4Fe-4S)-binding protein n=1 Tax=Kitasatospora sp. NPDC096147 TaxID=3364093 RepID=UPI0037FE1514
MAPAKEYRADGVSVSFDPALCRHAAECVRGLPEVFDTGRRPWISPGEAAPETVAEVVRRCPTGALTYLLTPGGPEAPDRPTTVTAAGDGRLLLRGDLRIDGRTATRAMLCGCGRTAGPPYCDRAGSCGDE